MRFFYLALIFFSIVNPGYAQQYEKDIQQIMAGIQKEEPLEKHLQKTGNLLVFLSFSMPEQSLESWLLQCKKLGATPVIRGLVDNSFRKTLQKIQHLSQKTGTGIQLDPILFKAFDIQQVPAVVYVKAINNCPPNMGCPPVHYSKLSGNVTLDYAIEKIRGES